MRQVFFRIIMIIVGGAVGYYTPKLSIHLINKKIKLYERNANEGVKGFLEKKVANIALAILTMPLWAVVAFFVNKPFTAFLMGMLLSLALMFSIIDICIHIIPNELVLPALVIALIYQLSLTGGKGVLISLVTLLAMMAAFLLLGIVLGINKVGMGDVKLAGVMGAALGYPAITTGVFVMAVLLLGFCAIGIAMKKINLKSMLPFAPFMMAGMVVALYCGII